MTDIPSDSVTKTKKALTRLRQVVTLGSLLLALVHIVWPSLAIDSIALVLIVIAIVPWLAPIFKSIEFPGGWKIQFQELQQAAARAETAGLLAPKAETLAAPEFGFLEMAERDPNLALAGLRIEIEKRLTQLALKHGMEVRRYGIGQLLRALSQRELLSQEERSVLADLVGLLNDAVHGAQVDSRAAEWAITIGLRLLKGLDAKLVEQA